MTKQALLEEFLRLSPDDQLDLLGEAWDAIAHDPENLPVPSWHLEELERRLREPAPRYLDWEQVRDRIGGKGPA